MASNFVKGHVSSLKLPFGVNQEFLSVFPAARDFPTGLTEETQLGIQCIFNKIRRLSSLIGFISTWYKSGPRTKMFLISVYVGAPHGISIEGGGVKQKG